MEAARIEYLQERHTHRIGSIDSLARVRDVFIRGFILINTFRIDLIHSRKSFVKTNTNIYQSRKNHTNASQNKHPTARIRHFFLNCFLFGCAAVGGKRRTLWTVSWTDCVRFCICTTIRQKDSIEKRIYFEFSGLNILLFGFKTFNFVYSLI